MEATRCEHGDHHLLIEHNFDLLSIIAVQSIPELETGLDLTMEALDRGSL
jgi:hypothetical protein